MNRTQKSLVNKSAWDISRKFYERCQESMADQFDLLRIHNKDLSDEEIIKIISDEIIARARLK